MEAIIVSFRRGKHTQYHNQMIIKPNDVDSKDKASELVGKSVSWKSPAGKEIKGDIRSAHGNKGALRVIFETGMPGQSLGNKVKIE